MSLTLTLFTAFLLATLKSSKCPGWMIPNDNGTFMPIWFFLLMTGLGALWITYCAVTWKRFARRVHDKIRWGEATLAGGTQPTWYSGWTQLNAMSAAQLEYNNLFMVVMIAWVLFTAAPLILMGIKCF